MSDFDGVRCEVEGCREHAELCNCGYAHCDDHPGDSATCVFDATESEAYAAGKAAGATEVLQQLMDWLREGGCRNDGWNGGDTVEMVDTFLTAKGIDTVVYECPMCFADGGEAVYGSQAALQGHFASVIHGFEADAERAVYGDEAGIYHLNVEVDHGDKGSGRYTVLIAAAESELALGLAEQYFEAVLGEAFFVCAHCQRQIEKVLGEDGDFTWEEPGTVDGDVCRAGPATDGLWPAGHDPRSAES